jgi:hypothetical protein
MSGGRFPIDFLEDYSDDAILEEVRRLAAERVNASPLVRSGPALLPKRDPR